MQAQKGRAGITGWIPLQEIFPKQLSITSKKLKKNVHNNPTLIEKARSLLTLNQRAEGTLQSLC